ncbi:amidohydrolase family protein [Planctomicrobium sp. SH664]|uniref:amidohydrolase family protein n=1 Tax=Planctomicrobium sp. SH664 TaxID=3448125 RepID=UPI003F5AE640
MILDVHSHVWEYPLHFGDDFRQQALRARSGQEVDLTVRYEDYRARCPEQTRTVVFGGKAKLSGIWVDDAYLAAAVARHPDTLLGFLSIDPTQPGWEDELRQGHQVYELRGGKLMPMYAGFRPDDSALTPFWEYANRHRLPVLLHTGTTFISQAPLECTLPRHLDAVAIRYPDLPIILSHLGHGTKGNVCW